MSDEEPPVLGWVEQLPEQKTQARGSRGPSLFWTNVVAALKQNPGVWALVRRNTPAVIKYNLKRGKYVTVTPAEEFEVEMRRDPAVHDKKRGDLYMRYVGENGEHA